MDWDIIDGGSQRSFEYIEEGMYPVANVDLLKNARFDATSLSYSELVWTRQ